MHCAELPLPQASGHYLLNDLKFGNKVYPAGHLLTPEDISDLKLSKMSSLFVAQVDDTDLSRGTALGLIAAKLAGAGTSYVTDPSGICRVAALHDGLFISSASRIAKFNALSPSLMINCLPPYAEVKADQIIAEVSLTLPFVPQEEIEKITCGLSGNVELLQVRDFSPQKAALLYVKRQNNASETRHFTAAVKKLVKRFAPLGVEFAHEIDCEFNIKSVAEAMETALSASPDVIFVLPPVQAGGAMDIVPTGILQLADHFACERIPQPDCADLLIAQKRNSKIIHLPYHYGASDSNLADNCILEALFNEKVDAADFRSLPAPELPAGLLLSGEEQNQAVRPQITAPDSAAVGAVILAAGIGSRSGRNKLMQPLPPEDKPLFLRAVEAALRSQARPVYLITGYHDEEMMPWLENYDINVLYNPAYRSGIKTSINLGLNSMPSFCGGAILLPADMPNITAEDIDRLIAGFDKNKERQLVLYTVAGRRVNPVIWSRSLYEQADVVPENAALRPVFLEHSDYITELVCEDESKFFDVTFPSDLQKISAKK